ncbi:hypothetical protein ACTFIW_005916 [Dictyostelium discoideum]
MTTIGKRSILSFRRCMNLSKEAVAKYVETPTSKLTSKDIIVASGAISCLEYYVACKLFDKLVVIFSRVTLPNDFIKSTKLSIRSLFSEFVVETDFDLHACSGSLQNFLLNNYTFNDLNFLLIKYIIH